jgi:hypothetical protein
MKQFFLIAGLLCAPLAHAQCGPSTPGYTKSGHTYAATTPGQSDVQAAITAENATPANGDIIAIPSGSCTWTGTITATFTVTVTIQGNTTISGNGLNCGTPPTFITACTATDNTILVGGSGGNPILHTFANGSSGQEVRVTGISFNANSQLYYNGILAIDGTSSGVQSRVDHCHFYNLSTVAVLLYQPGAYGVVDHNVVDVPANNTYNGFRVWHPDPNGNGPWNSATGFGGQNFTFIENNTINNGFTNDCNVGGTYVLRYNLFTSNYGGTSPPPTTAQSFAQSHAAGSIGSVPFRGCRAWEVYGNNSTFTPSGGAFTGEFQTSGTGLSWNNTSSGFNHQIALIEDRDNNGDYSQTAPPNGWGYCGTTQTGSASGWDGNINSNGSNGWPCIDQIGRGIGDLLSGTAWPTVCNQTLGCSTYNGQSPREDLEPVYTWEETCTSTCGTIVTVQSSNNNIQANRDYYSQAGSTAQSSPTSPFNGTSGTGWGTAANRPTTCTAGAGGSGETSPTGSYGVAYFATDANSGQGELYVCTSANNWTPVYQPYTYPHPLVGGTPPPAPAPAMFVRVTGQVTTSGALR